MRKSIDLGLSSSQIPSEITSVKLTSTIEPGTILISHPLVYGVLHRSVILVVESNDKGSYGLVINKFTDNTVNDSVRNLPDKVHRGQSFCLLTHSLTHPLMLTHLYPLTYSLICFLVFGNHKVFYGGIVRRLQYLHTFPNCGGIPIPNCSQNSLFVGGQINKVLNALNEETPTTIPTTHNSNDEIPTTTSVPNDVNPHHTTPSNHIKIFVGCCTWDVGKLDREYQAGYWIPVTSHLDECLNVDNTNDLWSILLNKLDAPYSDMACVPATIEASVVDNIDYDLH